uniref:Uncharacterized protein n=1 Tax=Cacopsylla melanoneura TaxID=428564 RepID=A0A8D8YLS6_9HEMI
MIYFQLRKFNNPIMLFKIVLNNMLFALCTYQLTSSDFKSMSKARLYKFLLEFTGVFVQFYYLCHSSEKLDDWQSRVNRAITESHWYKCSKGTRRDICMLLRRTQGPNHLSFYDGAIVLSRAYFLSVVKCSYNFVNFMRMNIQG